MVGLALKNIWGRKVRSILTILGIIVAMQLFIIMSSIMNTYEKDVQKQISAMAGKIMVQLKSDTGMSFLPNENVIKMDDARAVQALKGIDTENSTGYLFQSLVPPAAPNMPPAVLAVGIEPGKEAAYFGNMEITGQNRLKTDRDAILGAAAAANYDSTVGDTVTVRNETFNVVGILPAINTQLDSSFIITLATAQELFIRPGLVSGVILTAEKADEADKVAKEVEKAFPRLAASTSEGMKKSADEMLKGQRMFFSMINNTIIVVAAFIVMIVMVMSVFERKKEIGTLKAIGTSKGRILGMVVVEGLVISLIGGLLALPSSIVFTRLIYGDWLFDFSQWPQTVTVAVVLGVLAGLWPAFSAQRVNPLVSLRYE